MENDQIIKLWEEFAEGKDFKLNPDTKIVQALAEGVLKNEKNKGFRFCPCRLGDGSHEKNVDLLCPCNFIIHSTWKDKGRCWCGLFVKRE
ncbi:ferredoxin-thioredoxin reductase [Candidatus Woesearchaeota archaeon]|nr:ferredoxin-thioredoxin reductase [Candidatus Woesearchaeota archaeon]